jgi:hypothetical protein
MATVVYDVSDSPLLSAKVKGYLPPVLEEQTAWAAQLLGVDETAYTGDKQTKVKRAIALQLNYQALLDPEIFIKKSTASSQSKQSVMYRDGIPMVFPMAAAIVAEVIGGTSGADGWKDCRSVRRFA